jgi:hypothetical protein
MVQICGEYGSLDRFLLEGADFQRTWKLGAQRFVMKVVGTLGNVMHIFIHINTPWHFLFPDQ